MLCVQNSLLPAIGHPILNTVGNLTIGTWASVGANAVIASAYQTQNLGGTVTGAKFSATLNGVINNGGGINYFPGSVAGTVATGGQVV